MSQHKLDVKTIPESFGFDSIIACSSGYGDTKTITAFCYPIRHVIEYKVMLKRGKEILSDTLHTDLGAAILKYNSLETPDCWMIDGLPQTGE